jgi:hypothetical protein
MYDVLIGYITLSETNQARLIAYFQGLDKKDFNNVLIKFRPCSAIMRQYL